jgi:hypothetical protein
METVMGALAITIIVTAGLLIGLGVQYFTNPGSRLEWVFVALATSIGAVIGSEWLTSSVFDTLAGGPSIDGLVIVPGVIVGLALGLLADAFTRYIALEPA